MSLETIGDFFVAYQRTAAIKAAVELDLFTAIGEGRDTIADLAERCQAAVRGVRILCDYLTVVGLLRKEDGRYALGSAAEIVALDWPNVLAVAQGHAEEAGVAERYHTLPGSAFRVEFGAGYHLVLLVHFHQDLDPGTCEGLLAKIHAALVPGGRAVAL